MSALRRRHQLMASLRGTIPDDGRKTFTRRAEATPRHLRPDYRLCVLIPERWSLRAPGAGAAILGVTVEPDPISGPLAVAAGKSLEWVATQMGRFLLGLAAGDERVLSASLFRGDDVQASPAIAITPGLAAVRLSTNRIVKVTE